MAGPTRPRPLEVFAIDHRERERGLIWIRWIGIAFAILAVSLGPAVAHPVGYTLIGVLILGNLAILGCLRRATGRSLPALGLAALGLDLGVLLGFTYLYAFQRFGSTWLILYLVPFEAALRFGPRGTLATTAIISILYLSDEFYRQAAFNYSTSLTSIACRLGMLWIVALFAGLIARQLARERDAAQQLAQDRARLLVQLAEKDRLKSDFIATVSHELRTPLAVITGYLELLQLRYDRLTLPKRTMYLAEMSKAGLRLSDRIEALLDFALLEGNPLTLTLRETWLGPLVGEAIAVQQENNPRPDVHFESAVADDILVRVDSARLRRAIGHLLDNAVKFNRPHGTVTITCDQVADTAIVEIRDSGIGIPADQLTAIFDPFTQIESGDHKVFTGQGLGLTLARRIIEAHGGQIEVESQLGVGSTFRISLPATAPAPTNQIPPFSTLPQQPPVLQYTASDLGSPPNQ